MTEPLLYTAELDLDEADVAPFMHWYAYRHAPDVYQVGLLSCTCYRLTGGDMNLFDLYELPDWNLFETERYKQMPGRDPYMPPLMEKRKNKAHTLYDQRLILPAAPAPCLDADWIVLARFAAPASADEAIIAALTRAAPGWHAAGATRIRYATRGKDHPRNPTFRPRCMAVVEWAAPPPATAAVLPVLDGLGLSEAITATGHRLYPLPNRTA